MDEQWMIAIGNRIYDAIKLFGMRQKDVAARLNLSVNTVSRWTCGTKLIKLENLIRLCNLLDVEPDWILFGKGGKYEI